MEPAAESISDIRNKLSPIKNLMELLAQGKMFRGLDDPSLKNEVELCCLSITSIEIQLMLLDKEMAKKAKMAYKLI